MTDRLRNSLRDLADVVEPADLYDRSVHRSRTIARREATVGTFAALAALGLLASGLWRLPHDQETKDSPYALRSSPSVSVEPEPSPSPTAAATHESSASTGYYASSPPTTTEAPAAPTTPGKRKGQPQVSPTTPKPQSRALIDLPGHVFYKQSGAKPDVVRLTPSDGAVTTVLADAPSPVGISSDGRSIAYTVGDALLVARTGTNQAEQLATGVNTNTQAPTWSPDGTRLLVGTDTPAVLQVGSRVVTPLAGGLSDGRHFRWSGDGSKLVYATSFCGLKVTGGGNDTAVPVLGDLQPVDNPDRLAACKPTSVDVTGNYVTVPLQTVGSRGEGPDTGDAVVDTVTGDVVPLPVDGSVVGAVFAPDGNLLVRARHGDRTTLSLFSAPGRLLVQTVEPASVRDLELLAYTR
jgi:TolB protein